MGPVGKEQISQDGVVRLSHPTGCHSCPMFYKLWLCNSWDHLQHCACASWGICLVMGFVQYTCMSFIMKAQAPATLGLHWSNIMVMLCEVMLWLHYGYVLVMLWLLCQPGERLCYGYHSNQERINMSAVPVAPQIFFQPLSSHLAYPGSANSTDSVNSKMIGSVSWISNTRLDIMNLVFYLF